MLSEKQKETQFYLFSWGESIDMHINNMNKKNKRLYVCEL